MEERSEAVGAKKGAHAPSKAIYDGHFSSGSSLHRHQSTVHHLQSLLAIPAARAHSQQKHSNRTREQRFPSLISGRRTTPFAIPESSGSVLVRFEAEISEEYESSFEASSLGHPRQRL